MTVQALVTADWLQEIADLVKATKFSASIVLDAQTFFLLANHSEFSAFFDFENNKNVIENTGRVGSIFGCAVYCQHIPSVVIKPKDYVPTNLRGSPLDNIYKAQLRQYYNTINQGLRNHFDTVMDNS